MGAMTREEILDAIRQTAITQGGRAPGRRRLEQLTGVTGYDVGRYWARYGDAIAEAGLAPNALNPGLDDGDLIEKLILLARRLGHTPTMAEIRLERERDPTFPSRGAYARLGRKRERHVKMLAYCRVRPEYHDVAQLLEEIVKQEAEADQPDELSSAVALTSYGFVYLVRGHPREYKIGRTNLVDRRLSELGVASAVEQTLIHEIKTDDPVGVEAYWHSRFGAKRMRGEWFKLDAADVRAFRRWKKIH